MPRCVGFRNLFTRIFGLREFKDESGIDRVEANGPNLTATDLHKMRSPREIEFWYQLSMKVLDFVDLVSSVRPFYYFEPKV